MLKVDRNLHISKSMPTFALSKRNKFNLINLKFMNYMFNNRFCKVDNSIIFKPEEWTCTDPDQHQFCRKIDNTTFEYIQLKPKCELIDDVLKPPHSKDALEYLSGRTFVSDWYEDIIDVSLYTEQEIKEYLAPYGLPENMIDNQLIAECIFETDTVMGF